MNAWILQIFLDPCLAVFDLSSREEHVAPVRACGSTWRCVGGPMAADLPQIYRSMPRKHEYDINFACDEGVEEFF